MKTTSHLLSLACRLIALIIGATSATASAAPVVTRLAPADNSVISIIETNIWTNSFGIIFNENVELVSGTITIRNLTTGVDDVIPVDGNSPSGSRAWNFSPSFVFVTTGQPLWWETDYAIRIDPTAIRSVATGEYFAGFANDTDWNFRTADDPLYVMIQALKDHILGVTTLTARQIDQYQADIEEMKSRFGESEESIMASLDLANTYDTTPGFGPLFVNTGDFNRNDDSNSTSFDWTMYLFMQYVFDQVFTQGNLVSYENRLGGFVYRSSQEFPGSVHPAAPIVSHTATIDASYPDTLGWLRFGEDLPARKPTGTYLKPGMVATVTVPPALVNAGYKVRVGAHSWDLRSRNPVQRFERCTKLYDINAETIKVANPLGGGVYIEVPFGAGAGIVNVTIGNVVRSPFFSAKSFHTTTNSEWIDVESKHLGPWADFQSDKFMMQVPRTWVYNLADPAATIANWDAAIDVCNDLMGFPRDCGKETVYVQPDVIYRAASFAPGYPMVNDRVGDPTNDVHGGDKVNYMTRGPQLAGWQIIHELGHAYRFDKFDDLIFSAFHNDLTDTNEKESTVNLLHAAVFNQAFGYDLEDAFADSVGEMGNPYRRLDNTAVAWMCGFHFSFYDDPMINGEKAYQLKGHAKFVELASLFGWQVVNDFYHQLVVDDIHRDNSTLNADDHMLRMSRAVGYDIRPLFRFWGIHAIDPAALAAAIDAEGLGPAPEIYYRLLEYKALIPADNSRFRGFALKWWGRVPRIGGNYTEREHARQWDTTDYWSTRPNIDYAGTDPGKADGEIYTEESAARIAAAIDGLLDAHFPDYQDTDSDNDGMGDDWERANGLIVGTDDSGLDPDGDTRSNLDEFNDHTDPHDPASLVIPPPTAGPVPIANSSFENDDVADNGVQQSPPSSWAFDVLNFGPVGSGAGFVQDKQFLDATGQIAGAHSGEQYYLGWVHTNDAPSFAILHQDILLEWSSLAAGDILTLSVWATYRADYAGSPHVAMWLNYPDNGGAINSVGSGPGWFDVSPTGVAAPGTWTRLVWNYTVSQADLDAAAAGAWETVNVAIGFEDASSSSWLDGSQVAFDDVGLYYTPIGSFANWIAGPSGYFPGETDPEIIGLDADPDGDGIDNGVENFFGTPPDEFSQGLVAGAGSGNQFTFTHPLNDSPAGDLTATYRWSTDLQTFHADGASNGAGTTVSFEQGVPSGGEITVTATVDGVAVEKLFVDVQVVAD